jgi:hypothetical protein
VSCVPDDPITKTSVTTTSAPRTSERRLNLTVRCSQRSTQFQKRRGFNHFQLDFSLPTAGHCHYPLGIDAFDPVDGSCTGTRVVTVLDFSHNSLEVTIERPRGLVSRDLAAIKGHGRYQFQRDMPPSPPPHAG